MVKKEMRSALDEKPPPVIGIKDILYNPNRCDVNFNQSVHWDFIRFGLRQRTLGYKILDPRFN